MSCSATLSGHHIFKRERIEVLVGVNEFTLWPRYNEHGPVTLGYAPGPITRHITVERCRCGAQVPRCDEAVPA